MPKTLSERVMDYVVSTWAMTKGIDQEKVRILASTIKNILNTKDGMSGFLRLYSFYDLQYLNRCTTYVVALDVPALLETFKH